MNTILLQPTDVLFFRDGRPMGGSLAGHGAAWPMPNVINAAFHAALHRAFVDEPHIGSTHAPARRENGQRVYAAKGECDRRFVDVWSVGPFPVDKDGHWFFPRPADAQENGTVRVTLKPFRNDSTRDRSSLPAPLHYAVANTAPPDKEAKGEPWLNREAWLMYLNPPSRSSSTPARYLKDSDIFDHEHQIGIQIDPTTQTAGQGDAAGKIYSAHYLRLRDGFRLGTAAGDGANADSRVFDELFTEEQRIVVGGQQRVCTVEHGGEELPLPTGTRSFAKDSVTGKCLVKWALLTPAIWPEIPAERDGHPILDRDGKPIIAHHGGWLPNWVDLEGNVRLRDIGQPRPGGMQRKVWRDLLQKRPEIQARLVAALIPKPLTVTGWALNLQAGGAEPGAKSTHLAVPAGAVYYFETDSPEQAANLAATLNWHGDESTPAAIKNRRSALLGEKGFGLGVCGVWSEGSAP
ncbi:MAG: hypothetical protein HY360_17865 [Verrucomicrobia bacterium]|nr:hypothetical protein [Verrucomicrobiota bacterium]